MSTLNRRRFVIQTASGLALMPSPLIASQPQPATAVGPERAPALPGAVVNEFVRKAHADLAATKVLLAEYPGLLNATWDWGGGDFETGIGGAGHMGNHAIAEFLIEQGARLDVFVAAMLGRLHVVRALLTAWPGLLQSKGPHGISLLRHARAGGEQAKAVADYLLSLGAA